LLVAQGGKNFLVDVGWGRGMLQPLELKEGIHKNHKLELKELDTKELEVKDLELKELDTKELELKGNSSQDDQQNKKVWLLSAKNEQGQWKPQYQFDTAHHELSEFVDMCNFYQYSSESHFRRKVYCGKETISGYFDLQDLKQTLYNPTLNLEQSNPSQTLEPLEYRVVLQEAFGISLSNREFERLLHGWQVRGVLEPAKARAALAALEAKKQAQILQAQQAHQRSEHKPHSLSLEPEKTENLKIKNEIKHPHAPIALEPELAPIAQVQTDQNTSLEEGVLTPLEEFFDMLLEPTTSSEPPLEMSLVEFFYTLAEADPPPSLLETPAPLETPASNPPQNQISKQPFVILNGMSKMVFKIGVVGAGQMGSGIAQVAAQAGFSVVIQDALPTSLERSQHVMHTSLDKLYEKGKIYESPHTVLERIEFSPSLGQFADCDLVIEAIVENEKLKLELFMRLHSIVKPSGIFASNTSSIPITKLATASQRPDRFIGMHFMNPVPIMALVEVIRGYQTSDATSSQVIQIAELMGKTALECNDSPGFISNRILMPMINEAIQCVMEGIATPEAIDGIMKLGMNHPMGPLTLADFIGLDTCLAIMEVLREGLGSKYQASPLLKKMVQAGLLGRKSGEGFYKYP
jgi:3-hydroxybutyryl-CoA dehydrogenase